MDQRVGGDHGGDQDGNDIDDLDHGVDRRPCSVLVRVAHRVTGDGGGVGFGALATIVPVLDVLLRVVPGTAARGHLNGKEEPGHDAADQHSAERFRPEGKSHEQWRGYWDQSRKDHLPLRRPRDEINRPAILRLRGAFHQTLDLTELAPDLDHDLACVAAYRKTAE